MIRNESKSNTIRQALKQTGVKSPLRKFWELYRAAWLETPFWASIIPLGIIFLTIVLVDMAADAGILRFIFGFGWLAG